MMSFDWKDEDVEGCGDAKMCEIDMANAVGTPQIAIWKVSGVVRLEAQGKGIWVVWEWLLLIWTDTFCQKLKKRYSDGTKID